MIHKTMPTATLVAIFVMSALLTACSLFKPEKFEYCEGTQQCCGLIDTRDSNRKKYFCVDNPNDCVQDHEDQTIDFPASPGEGFCRAKQVSLEINRYEWIAGGSLTRMLIQGAASQGRAWRVALHTGSCPRHCTDPASPHCARIPPLEDNAALAHALESSRRRLEAPAPHTPIKEYMALFAVKEDPCERADIVFDGRTLSNEGAQCVLKAQVATFQGAQPIALSIEVPGRVSATHHATHESLKLHFENTLQSPHITLSDEGLNAEWGGIIHSIEASDTRVIVETESGCIAFSQGTRA